ncbi:MAG: glycosyltransferase family 39 protein [Bacteroidota bacterium]
MKSRIRLTNETILLLILMVATALRFYNFGEIPFTHDEFSALFRTNFDGFSEMIQKGVKPDGHPAGIQVFLYFWVKLFGKTEWVVKLPFAICGILSVYLVYAIAKQWFNETVGLISSAFIASIQYTVMYSQIARPYISGLFFSLLMVYYLTKLIKTPEKHFYKNGIFFILSASLCTYNHYFSLLFAAIAGISGLFFIKKKYVSRYIISGIIIFILYLPHLNIFFHHLEMGGVEGWLGKPNNDFIINYIHYIFNFSHASLGLALFLILFGMYKIKVNHHYYKYSVLSLLWFLLPLLIGFYYSVYVNAVLQYSVLIFSLPFLFFVLFGHIKQHKVKTNLMLVCIILLVNASSLIFERKHYDLFYNSRYECILKDYHKINKANDNVLSIIDSHKKITAYYLSKFKIEPDFIWFDSFKSDNEFKLVIQQQSKSHEKLFFGCLSSTNILLIPIIQEYYPVIEKQNNYFGGNSYLFSKKGKNKNAIISSLKFETTDKTSWNADTSKYTDSISYEGNNSYFMDCETLWGPKYSEKLNKIINNKNNYIDISVKAKSTNGFDDIILVASLTSNDSIIHWRGSNFNKFADYKYYNGNWVTIHNSIKLSDATLNYDDLMFSTYIWNKGGKSFYMDNFRIKIRKGNPVIYGLLEKF